MKANTTIRRILALTGALGLVGIAVAPAAFAETVGIQSATVKDELTATSTPPGAFVPVGATTSCGAGSTLLGGGARLSVTASGADIFNDGAVLPSLYPSDASGVAVTNGATTPSSWSALMMYTGMVPGTDSITSFAMCSSGGPAATVVKEAVVTGGVGPVTAVCPSGSGLVGGGGGYLSAVTGISAKTVDSYPSDTAGNLPPDGSTPNAWTVRGNSSPGTPPDLHAYAVCSTDVNVTTQTFSTTVAVTNPGGGSGATSVYLGPATATCPGGSTLLTGGVRTDTYQTSTSDNNQGIHMLGTYPSDSTGTPVTTGSASSWTVRGVMGGQASTGTPDPVTLREIAYVLCDTTQEPVLPEAGSLVTMVGLGGVVLGGFLVFQRRFATPRGGMKTTTTLRLRRFLALTGVLGITGIAVAPAAFAETVGIQSTTVADTLTTTSTPSGAFLPVFATSTCGAGSTLLGGGARISVSAGGGGIGNDGAVIPGLFPSDASGNALSTGAVTAASWSGIMMYTGMVPGTDSITGFAMCATGGPAATVIQASTQAPGTTSPYSVRADCPSGTTLVGGGGGYAPPNNNTAFNSGNSEKVISSYPSDTSGAPPADGFTGTTSWTVWGNTSNPAGAQTLNAYAVCATDLAVTTQVAATSITSTAPAGSTLIAAPTATCPPGSTMLDGGSHMVIPNPNNVASPNQGAHMVGSYPSDGSGAAVTTGPASSWTVREMNGGMTGVGNYVVSAFALCDVTQQAVVPEFAYPALMVGLGAALVGGFLARQKHLALQAS